MFQAIRAIARMPAVKSLPLAGLLCGLVSACATVDSNVEVFHELPADYHGASITILPGDEKKNGTLEFKSYSGKLATRLNDAGFRVVDANARPRFAVFLGYVVGDSEEIVSSYTIPQFGITGYNSSQTYGTLNTYGTYGTYSGTTTYNPTYGVTGYTTGITSEIIYPRVVLIDIYEINWSDIESSPQVYHLVISSADDCSILSQVIDEMLDAGFQDFPGENGSARQIELPAVTDC